MSTKEITVCDICGREAGPAPGPDEPTVEGWAQVSVEVGSRSGHFGVVSVERHVCSDWCFCRLLERLAQERAQLLKGLVSRSPKTGALASRYGDAPLEGGSYRSPPRST